MAQDGGNHGVDDRSTKRRAIYLILVLLSVLAIACGIGFCTAPGVSINPLFKSARATKEAEALLTEMYGETVRSAVKNYWLVVGSLEADRDPAIRSQVETGRWLRIFSVPPGVGDMGPLMVLKSLSMGKIRVLEYEPERRFRAVVCVVRQDAEVTPEGELLQLRPPEQRQGIYVFLYEDDVWKLAGRYDTTDYDAATRYWWHVPEWLQEIIQEVPDWEPCD